MAKLSKETVAKIVDELQNTYKTQSTIAKEFGITKHSVSHINVGKTHRSDKIDYPIRKELRHPTHLDTVKVSWKKARTINIQNELLYTDKPMKQIAKEYGVAFSTVSRINRGGRGHDDKLFYPLRVTGEMLGDKVRADYTSGLSLNQIQDKYNLDRERLTKFLRGVRNDKTK